MLDPAVKEKTEETYRTMLATFKDFLKEFFENPSAFISEENLSEYRAVDAIDIALEAYGIDWDELNSILNSSQEYETQGEKLEREFWAGVSNNLITFSVAQEYQLLRELEEVAEEHDTYDEFEAEALGVFSLYNKTYAAVENSDINHRFLMAQSILLANPEEIFVYSAINDERTRDTHRALDGYRLRRSEIDGFAFIPPWEHGCRCTLQSIGSVDGRKLNANRKDIDIKPDPVFNTKFYKTGNMFGEKHSYFNIKKKHSAILKNVVESIKEKLNLL